MIKEEIIELKKIVEFLEEQFEDPNVLENENYDSLVAKVYDTEEKIDDCFNYANGFQETKLQNLKNRITQIKNDNEFYDEEAELDRALPNRHDEDFDD